MNKMHLNTKSKKNAKKLPHHKTKKDRVVKQLVGGKSQVQKQGRVKKKSALSNRKECLKQAFS